MHEVIQAKQFCAKVNGNGRVQLEANLAYSQTRIKVLANYKMKVEWNVLGNYQALALLSCQHKQTTCHIQGYHILTFNIENQPLFVLSLVKELFWGFFRA